MSLMFITIVYVSIHPWKVFINRKCLGNLIKTKITKMYFYF
jgi:hypothetical protein